MEVLERSRCGKERAWGMQREGRGSSIEENEWQRSEEVKEVLESGGGKCKAVKVDGKVRVRSGAT